MEIPNCTCGMTLIYASWDGIYTYAPSDYARLQQDKPTKHDVVMTKGERLRGSCKTKTPPLPVEVS